MYKSDVDGALQLSTLPSPLSKYLTPKDVEQAVFRTYKVTVGPSGWSSALIKIVAGSKNGKTLLAAFLTRLLQNKFPADMMQALCGGALTVLSKPNSTGVRPIVLSDAFVRLLAKTIVVREQKLLGQDLAPLQAGVGLSGGVEFVIHTVRHLLHSHGKDWACISIDCKNAYGSVLLSTIQHELQLIKHGRADLIAAYFDNFVIPLRKLKSPGVADDDGAIDVRDGIIQGDPVSPLLFCLALQPVLRAVQDNLKSGHVFGYLDDVVLVGPVADIFPAFELFKSKAATISLTVNLTKTKVLSLHAQTTPSESTAPVPSTVSTTGGDNATVMDMDTTTASSAADTSATVTSTTAAVPSSSTASLSSRCTDHGLPAPSACINILGSPVGDPKQEAYQAVSYVKDIPFKKLKELEHHQIRLALLRDTMSQAVNHLARTVPPSCVRGAFKSYDGKILDVIRTCLEAQPEEISSTTRKEISLPTTHGGFGFQQLADTCHLSYYASVSSVLQTWLLFKKADDPLLKSWVTDPDDFVAPLPQPLSKFSLPGELKACLALARHVTTQAVQSKAASQAPTLSKSKSKYAADAFSMATSSVSVNKNAFALSILPSNLAGLLVYQKKRNLQSVLMKCKAAVDAHEFLTKVLSTNEDKAQFNSKCGPGAAAFLRALPSDPSLSFENKHFMLALRLHLRLPVIHKFGVQPGMPCHCARPGKHGAARLTEDHLLNCNGSNVMNTRHDAIKNAFAHLIRYCKLTPEFEELAGPGTGKVNRYDISADRYNDDNKDLKVDVTVVNPTTRARAKSSALRRGDAALKQRHKKIEKYAPFLTPSDDFYPLVFESYGLIDTPVLGLVSALADRVNNLPPESATWVAPTFKSYAIQRLSCCLWRENARMIETVIVNTALVYEYEKYSYADYEDPVLPQFQLTADDFPPLAADKINKVSFVQDKSAEKVAALTTSAAVHTSHVDITTIQDMVDLTLDDGFSDGDHNHHSAQQSSVTVQSSMTSVMSSTSRTTTTTMPVASSSSSTILE